MNAMTNSDTQTTFSAWERQVFAAMTDVRGEYLPLPELNNLLAQATEPIDSALANVVTEFISFIHGEAGDKDVEISANIIAACDGHVEGSEHSLLSFIHFLQKKLYWGDTEEVLHEVIRLCEVVEADPDLQGEKELFAFLYREILLQISLLFISTRDEVEGGYVTHMTIEDIDKMDDAIGRVGELSKA